MTYPYGAPDQQYPQGPPPQQGYAPPQQNGYPQQGYQQGPPPQQYAQPTQYAPTQPYQGAPPQQNYPPQGQQWGPPPQGGYQQQNGQQQAPPAIPGTLDAFYSQPSTGGGVPWSFENIGQEYFGIVRRPLTDGDTEQQYTLGQNPVPATFKDGRAKLVLRVPLNVPRTAENPEGTAQWYCRSTTRDQLGAAMASVGAPQGPPEVGSGIYVKFVGTKKSGQGMNPSKVYDVRYWRPEQAKAIAQQMGIEFPNPPTVPEQAPAVAPPVPGTPAQPHPDSAPAQPPAQAPQGPPPAPQPDPQQYAAQGPAQGQYGPPPQQGYQQGPPQQGYGQAPPPPPVQWQAAGAPGPGQAPPGPGYVPQPTGQQAPPPQQDGGGLLGALTGR